MVIQYFIISILCSVVGIEVSRGIIIGIAVVLALIRAVPMMLELTKSRKITRFLTILGGIILWATFMYIFEVIFFEIVGLFTQLPNIINVIIILLVPLFAIIGYYNATHNYLRSYELYLNNWQSKNLKPFSILHISDLHIGSMQGQDTIRQVVRNLNKIAEDKRSENVDVITILSGDAVDGSCPIDGHTFDEFKKLTMPIFFTPGNHDYYRPLDKVKESLSNAGVVILDNDNIVLEDLDLNIIGVMYSFTHVSEEYKLPIKEGLNNILIYHAPLYWDEFSSQGIELMLSGHTHGGQFPPANWLLRIGFKYNHGLFSRIVKIGDKTFNAYLSVTNGIGTFAAPIRLATHSEITILNINRIKKNSEYE